MIRLSVILGLVLALAGCGGSSGGTDTAGTTPPPAGPTEVARQVPVNTTVDVLTQVETFNTVASTAVLTLSNGLVTSASTTQAGFKDDVTIAYNPATQGYTVTTGRGIGKSTAFTSADFDETVNGVTSYSKVSQGEDAQLLITRTGLLKYSALGAWTSVPATNGTGTISASLFVFGQETSFATLPKTGTATYNLGVSGIARDGANAYGLGGGGSANVNFAANSLTTIFNLGVFNGGANPIATYAINGTATISSTFARFSGTTQGTLFGVNVSGPFHGAFFGPAAEEIGGSFKVTGGQVEAIGAFVGSK